LCKTCFNSIGCHIDSATIDLLLLFSACLGPYKFRARWCGQAIDTSTELCNIYFIIIWVVPILVFANGDWAIVSLILPIHYCLHIAHLNYVHLYISTFVYFVWDIALENVCVSIFCRVSCIPLSFLYGFNLHAFLYGNKVKQNKAFLYKLVATWLNKNTIDVLLSVMFIQC
jgi:hypothetical protein